MRQPTERVYVALQEDDGTPLALHMKKDAADKLGAEQITQAEAQEIKAERAARKPKPVPTIWGEGQGDPPSDWKHYVERELAALNKEVDVTIEDALNALEMRLTQLTATVADMTTLTTVRFQAIAAEQDEAPSHAAYPDLGQVLGLPGSATPEQWKDAIARFKRGAQ